MISLTQQWCESVFNLFLFRHEFEVVFSWIVKKISFSRTDFVDSEIVIFIKEFNFYSKNDMYQIVKRKSLFYSNNVPEIHIFISWQHQKLLLTAKQLQDSTFLFQINSKDKGISKLLLKLLPSLFELKDNDTIVMSTIIKKLQNMSRNRSFLISEIVRLLLLSQVTNAESEAIFSALKPVITYLRSTMRNNRLQALILVHVHRNILDNINLADVANEFVDRKDSRKHKFRRISQNYS